MSFPRPLKKPRHLQPGDRIAVVSPSWGGPGTYPHRYEAGVRQLEAEFGVQPRWLLRRFCWSSD